MIDRSYSEYIKIFTDGSNNSHSETAGCGFVMYDTEGHEITAKRYKLDHRLSVYSTELVAIVKAL